MLGDQHIAGSTSAYLRPAKSGSTCTTVGGGEATRTASGTAKQQQHVSPIRSLPHTSSSMQVSSTPACDAGNERSDVGGRNRLMRLPPPPVRPSIIDLLKANDGRRGGEGKKGRGQDLGKATSDAAGNSNNHGTDKKVYSSLAFKKRYASSQEGGDAMNANGFMSTNTLRAADDTAQATAAAPKPLSGVAANVSQESPSSSVSTSIRVFIKLVSNWGDKNDEEGQTDEGTFERSIHATRTTATAASPAVQGDVSTLLGGGGDGGGRGGGVADERRASNPKSPSRVPWEYSTILGNYSELLAEAAANASVNSSHVVGGSERSQKEDVDREGEEDFYSPVAARRINLAASSSNSRGSVESADPYHKGSGGATTATNDYNTYVSVLTREREGKGAVCCRYCGGNLVNERKGGEEEADQHEQQRHSPLLASAYHSSWDEPFKLVSSVDLTKDTIDTCVIKAMASAAHHHNSMAEGSSSSAGNACCRHCKAKRKDKIGSTHAAEGQQRTTRPFVASSYSCTSSSSKVLSSYDIFLGDKNGYIVGAAPLIKSRSVNSAMDEAYSAAALAVSEAMEKEEERERHGHNEDEDEGYEEGRVGRNIPPETNGTEEGEHDNNIDNNNGRLSSLREIHQQIVDSYSDFTPLPPFSKASDYFFNNTGATTGDGEGNAVCGDGGDAMRDEAAGIRPLVGEGGLRFLSLRRSLVVVPRPPPPPPSSSSFSSSSSAAALSSNVYKEMNAHVAKQFGMVEKHLARVGAERQRQRAVRSRAINEARIAEEKATRHLASVLRSYKLEDNRLVAMGLAKQKKV